MNLRAKLFLLIFIANLTLISLIGAFAAYSFQRQFGNYLSNVEVQRLDPLVQALSDEYRIYGHWKKYRKSDELWQQRLQEFRYLLRAPSMPHMGARQPGGRMQTSAIILTDRDKNRIAGDQIPNQAIWIDIPLDGNIVGYLVIKPRQRPIQDLERAFIHNLSRMGIVIGLGAIFISAALAGLFSRRLVKPILQMQQGTRQLASGDFNLNLPVRGKDELAELASNFNWLAATLENNLKSRQQWIADISHELRTPVAVMQAQLEAMIDGIRPLNETEVRFLQSETGRLSDLIADLHQLSMSDSGSLSYQMESLDLNTLITDYVMDKPEITVSLAQQPVTVQADEARLVQLLDNLYSNSQRYSDDPLRIEIQVDTKGQLLWSDSGPGVPDEALPRLFDRLYRVDRSRNRHKGGSGLGLAICASIAQAHGAEISARHSDLGGLCIELNFKGFDA